MSTNVDFTASVDRDLFKRAEVVAAKTGTSVNALCDSELRYPVETFEAAGVTGNRNFRTLLYFSLGHIDGSTAMESLELESEEDFFADDGPGSPADADADAEAERFDHSGGRRLERLDPKALRRNRSIIGRSYC